MERGTLQARFSLWPGILFYNLTTPHRECLLSATSRRAVQLFGLSLVNLKYPVISLMHCQYIVSIYHGIDKCAGLFANRLTASHRNMYRYCL